MRNSSSRKVAEVKRERSAGRVLEDLDRDGYSIIEGCLDPADVAAKRADLHRVLESVPTGRNDFEGYSTRRIYALFAKTRLFDAQAIDPLVLDVVGRRLGPGFQLSAPVGISIGPGEIAQPVHRDDDMYPLERPHRDLVVNTMWAGLAHGGGANRTDCSRLGVIIECCAGWLRPQENHVLGVPKQIVQELPRALQELLGYNVVGLLGNVDGRHPLKYLTDNRAVSDGVIDPAKHPHS
jgi:ectoine hydroxylase-related dioxygenase (phytanoyl-CoA dioxygenase family)